MRAAALDGCRFIDGLTFGACRARESKRVEGFGVKAMKDRESGFRPAPEPAGDLSDVQIQDAPYGGSSHS